MTKEERTLQDGEGVEEEPVVEETEEETTEEEAEVDETEDETTEDEYKPPTEEEYKKVLQEKENYKKGMLKAKAGLKKKGEPTDKSEFVTKADLQKDKEQRAIKEVLIENPEMDADWTKMVGYVPKVSPSDDIETIKKKIKAGHAGYKSTLDESDSDDDNKETKATLSETKGKGGTTPPPPKKERKKILNTKQGGMSEWYK